MTHPNEHVIDLNLDVLAVLRSEETRISLRDAWTDMNGTKVRIQVGEPQLLCPSLSLDRRPDALLLDIDPNSPDGLDTLHTTLKKKFPSTPIIATAKACTSQEMRQIMRLGAIDFLPQPFARQDILLALKAASSKASDDAEQDGCVISFLKGGGGVGATTVAVQSACALANFSRRDHPSVAVLDFDLQFGTVPLYLDLEPTVGLGDIMESQTRLDGTMLESIMMHHRSGVHVMAPPSEVIPLEVLSPDLATACVDLARTKYDFVVVDLPESWTEWSYRVLQRSDLIVLVTQLTVSGIRQARRQLETITAQGLNEKQLKIILNRHDKGWVKSREMKNAEKALGRQVDYCIPSNYGLVHAALNNGVRLAEIKRHSRVERRLRDFVGDVRKGIAAVNEPRLQRSR